jgi:hypothetical protein
VGHPAAIGRVLGNLTTNALRFTESGFVRVSAEKAGEGDVEYAVRDTGGESRGSRASLFDPFRPALQVEGSSFQKWPGSRHRSAAGSSDGSELRFETREDGAPGSTSSYR